MKKQTIKDPLVVLLIKPFTWIGALLFLLIGMPIKGIIIGWILANDDTNKSVLGED